MVKHNVRVLSWCCLAWMGLAGGGLAGPPPEAAVQGLYEGTCKGGTSERKLEARVVACGRGTYKVFLRESLGGSKVDKAAKVAKVAKVELDGKIEGGAVRFTGKAGDAVWTAAYADGQIRGTCGPEGTLDLKRIARQSPTLGAKPPAGAIVLLDGKTFDELTTRPLRDGREQPWKAVEGGGIEVPKGGMNSKRRFDGSFRLHVEFKLPLMPEARDQGRANSGVYLPNGDEIQVLDSFGMTSYQGGGCGGLYAYKDPDAFDQFSLASLPPLVWQTFDVEYRVEKKDGKPVGKPRVTVCHNGIKIHDNVELRADARVGGFHFQDHGNPVEYRNIWVLPLGALWGTCPAATKPNLIVILVDDMGFSDIGCYGSEIPTPHLDQLAAGGLRFTQFYNTPRCSPTRACLLTGLYPHQAGMGWLDNKVEPQSRGFHGKLLPRCVTIAEVLRGAGYFTAMTGKWHMGQQNGTPPWERGFMRSLNSRYGEVYFPKESDRPGTGVLYLNGREIRKDSPELGKDWYSTDLFVDWGLKFIDEARAEKKPFFLYIAQGAVHFPLRAPAEAIARYRGKYMKGWDKLREERHARQIQMGIVDARWPLSPRPEDSPAWDTREPDRKKRFDEIMSVYAAMVECIDRSVGSLVAGLRQRGILDQTLIVFLSDNGGNAEGGPPGVTRGEGPVGGPQSYVLLGMNWATLANTPFRRYKHFTHEGGISTAMIAHWPKGIPAQRRGRLEKQPGHLVDIMATAVDLAGAKYPAEFNGNAVLPMEGTSLRPAFEGKPLDRRQPIFWEHEGNKAVRDGKWKLVQKWRGPWELYDMEADRTELHNLAATHPEVAARLEAAWKSWQRRAFVDEWTGPDHTNWGQDIRPAKAP